MDTLSARTNAGSVSSVTGTAPAADVSSVTAAPAADVSSVTGVAAIAVAPVADVCSVTGTLGVSEHVDVAVDSAVR